MTAAKNLRKLGAARAACGVRRLGRNLDALYCWMHVGAYLFQRRKRAFFQSSEGNSGGNTRSFDLSP